MSWPSFLDSFLKEWEVAECWSSYTTHKVWTLFEHWPDIDGVSSDLAFREMKRAEDAVNDAVLAFLIAASYHAPWFRAVDKDGNDYTWVLWKWALS